MNLPGLRSIAAVQVLTTVLKFVPLLFMATVGLLFIKSANFGAFNASGGSALGAISAAGAIALFSYLGIETASVAAGRVRNPQRNVGRATVLGTLACAFVYILGTITVFGTVAHGALVASSAPVHRLGQRDLRRSLGRRHGRRRRDRLRPRRAGRLDADRRPRCRRRPRGTGCSRPGSPARAGGRAGVRDRRSTVLASVLTVVSYTSFDHGVHHHRPALGADLGHPVPVLGRRAAVLAA